MNRIIIGIFYFLLYTCCVPNKIISPDDVTKITIYSIPRNLESDCAISSAEELLEWNKMGINAPIQCRDTIITDKIDLTFFTEQVNKLKPCHSCNCIDIRTLAVIHLKSNVTINLCFGAYFGTMKEGLMMKDNNRLFDYFDKKIYSFHPDSYWWGTMTKVIMSNNINEDKGQNI